MNSWNKRTREVAHLLNPAFCGRMLYSAINAYSIKTKRAFPFPLVYLVLPLVLHKETRANINSRTQLHLWVQQHPQLLIDFPQRTTELIIVDKPERPVPLKQLGSGSNWVGVHLIAYFALQHYFIGAKRPVPRFMFLDQPSQVYFPSEFDEKKTDWNEVNKIYQFVIDRTTELQGQLQVIIVDHADLKKDSFREFIRENWWPDDKNLVPIDWYKSE